MLTDDELEAMEARWRGPPLGSGTLGRRLPRTLAGACAGAHGVGPAPHLCDAPPAYVADLAGGGARENAAFIAASKQDMPRLIAEVRRLRRQAAGAPATIESQGVCKFG
jgi:hypothetical protein